MMEDAKLSNAYPHNLAQHLTYKTWNMKHDCAGCYGSALLIEIQARVNWKSL